MKHLLKQAKLVIGTSFFFLMTILHAGGPLWTFTPLTSTSVIVPGNGTKTIQYLVTNQSKQPHRLVMTAPINPGITQITTPGNCTNPINLPTYLSSCVLNLQITGSLLQGVIAGGPKLCEQSNPLQCYEPCGNQLYISKGVNEHTVGGEIFGLIGELVLQNNGGDDITETIDDDFVFPTALLPGQTYSVTIKSKPPGQTCTVFNGTGIIGDSNVTDVDVFCSTDTNTVGGTISGLAGSVILQNSNGDNILLNTNGSFTFPTPLPQEAPYDVTVAVQPFGQTCSVSNGSGTISGSDITNVMVVCATHAYAIGGTTTGLTGTVTLQNNGTNNLIISANGPFTFSTPVSQGSPYTVTILTQPANQTCTITNGTGVVPGANVTNVGLNCIANATTLSVSVNAIALSVNNPGANAALTGKPRTITVKNTGNDPANGVLINYPTWPAGTSAASNCPATLAPGATCTITITPGINATSTCTNGTEPMPGNIFVMANNANSVTTSAVVLGYGCVRNSGYIYSINDTTPATGNVVGKVLSGTNQAPPLLGQGVLWSATNAGIFDGGPPIFGIAETSTTVTPIPSTGQVAGQVACNGRDDGFCDTNNIFVYYSTIPVPPLTNLQVYAAGRCRDYNAGDGIKNWYMPAICEMGPDTTTFAGCVPGTQNVVNNLTLLLGNPASPTPGTSCTLTVNCLAGPFWSSTQYSNGNQSAWSQIFSSAGSIQNFDSKGNRYGVRCSRTF